MTDEEYRASLIEAALTYAERGWPVHAIIDGKGRTLGYEERDGVRWGSTTDAGTIRAWARRPFVKIGIPTGPRSGLLVIDVDDEAAWRDLKTEKLAPEPSTLSQRTGRDGGGRQYVFEYPAGETIGNARGGLPTGIDVRGDGGQFVAPPSRHESGRTYSWVDPSAPVERLPGWLLAVLKEGAETYEPPDVTYTGAPATKWGAAALAAELDRIENAPEGEGNAALYLAACKVSEIANGGHVEWEKARAAIEFAAMGDGRRNPIETRRTIASARKKTEGHARGPKVEAPTAPSPSGSEDEEHDETDALADGFRSTDAGNARRLIARASGRMRFVRAWGKWIVFERGKWKIDTGGALIRGHALEVALELYAASERLTDDEARKAMRAWAKASEMANRIAAMITLAACSELLIEHDELDAKPYLLNVSNGTIDLQTGEFRDHDTADLLTIQSETIYDPSATCPTFDACLRTWQPDPEIRDYLQLEAGAGATGRPTETLSIHFGSGGNGKSKCWGAIQHVLGEYAFVPHKSLLIANRHEQHETVKADLFGKRLGIVSESKAADTLDDEQVKSLTGGDRMRARRMREDTWYFAPTHTLVIFTNHKPQIRGADEAVWRRVRLIPWNVTIPEAERDLELAEKLAAEASGILLWIIEGARRFLAGNFETPDVIRVATADYRAGEDLTGRFCAEVLNFEPRGVTFSIDITSELDAWCREQGVPPLTMNDLSPVLRAHGCTSKRRESNGRRGMAWTGVAIESAEVPFGDEF